MSAESLLIESVSEIKNSETFRRSRKMQELLNYLAAKTVEVGLEKLTAGFVASDFYGIKASDKSSIHRVQINRLKSLLEQYYKKEGLEKSWQLIIPKNSYGLKIIAGKEDQTNFSPRLAVVPFVNLGGDSFQEKICIGLSQDLIHFLAQSRTLKIISLSNISDTHEKFHFKYLKDANLVVDYIVQGSVRFKPTAYEILIQLLDVKTNQVMWTNKFALTTDPNELFDVQNEIALKIAAQLATPSGVMSRLVRSKPSDGSAYTAVLHFYAYMERYTPESHVLAKQTLLDAVNRAPHYAEAWACLAGVYWNEHVFGFDHSLFREDLIDQSIGCAQQALSIAPDCVTAIYALATAYYQKGELALFKEYSQRALILAPYRADILGGIGVFKTAIGEWDDGLSLMGSAREMMPIHPDWYWFPYLTNAYRLNQLASAMDYINKINPKSFPHSKLFLAAIFVRQKKIKEAKAAFKYLLDIYPDLPANLSSYLKRLFPHSEIQDLLLQDLKHIFKNNSN